MIRMLGPRIAALRREAGLSQAELAARLKISPSAIGMYEQGRREPAVQTLVALAREFHVSTDFLLTGELRSEPAAADLSKQLSRLSRQELAVLFAALLTEP